MRKMMLIAALAAVVGAFVAAPVAVVASHQFTDVADGHTFHDDIEWMADNGITFGCGSGNYCPEDEVTRGQMAAFMKRLATNQVVDAGALEGLTAQDLASAQSFEFQVAPQDWGNNLHYGDGMVFRGFNVTPDLVGGINLVSVFDDGAIVLVYVRAGGNNSFDEWMLMPHMHSLDPDDIGIRVEYSLSRGRLFLARTTQGWDALSLSDAQLPQEMTFKIMVVQQAST